MGPPQLGRLFGGSRGIRDRVPGCMADCLLTTSDDLTLGPTTDKMAT